jgi:hypothetical protein
MRGVPEEFMVGKRDVAVVVRWLRWSACGSRDVFLKHDGAEFEGLTP